MRTRRRRVSRREREARRKRRLRRLGIVMAVALLCAAAMTPPLRAHIAGWLRRGMNAAAAFAPGHEAQAEVTLPKKQVYALQLGAYDSGERAQSEMQRLTQAGVPCVIWQREQMRIVCDAALTRDGLSAAAAQGQEAYTVQETLAEVVLRVSADSAQVEAVQALISLPDSLLEAIGKGEELGTLLERTRVQAQAALTAHPDHALYTQLAQSLVNWCQLIEQTREARGEEIARSYAGVTICTLCYELRQALLADAAQSEAMTASAQRTPSTAADVMPPA